MRCLSRKEGRQDVHDEISKLTTEIGPAQREDTTHTYRSDLTSSQRW